MKKLELQFLQSELNRTSEWIRFSDRKTAFLSVYYSLGLSMLIAQKKAIADISITDHWEILMLIATGIVFLCGVAFLFLSIFPRIKNKLTNESLFFFGSIADMKFIDFHSKMKKLKEKEAIAQIIEQIYTNSTIAKAKMENTQWSIRLLFLFVLLLVTLITII